MLVIRFQRSQRFGREIYKLISQTGFIEEETEGFYFILKKQDYKKIMLTTEYLADAEKKIKVAET